MKILVTGATGFVGESLCERLIIDGHDLVVLSRSASSAQKKLGLPAQYFTWSNPDVSLAPEQALVDIDVVIHLMGKNLTEKRWTREIKSQIYSSRIDSTLNLARAFEKLGTYPRKIVSASAVGFYGECGKQEVDESHSGGSDFLSVLTADWERAVQRFSPFTRTVSLRTGIVLDREGGFLERIRPLAQWGILGAQGSGRQWQSWIHKEDLVRLIVECATADKFEGVINAVAPQPLRNKELMAKVCHQAKRWLAPPVPSLLLHIALGEMSQMLLCSAKVVPQKLMEGGFEFKFPNIGKALNNVYSTAVVPRNNNSAPS